MSKAGRILVSLIYLSPVILLSGGLIMQDLVAGIVAVDLVAEGGRDSFYPAMRGGCLVTLLLLSFNNIALFGTAISLVAAAVIGLGIAQSKSRSAKL